MEPEINHKLSELEVILLCALIFCIDNQDLTSLKDQVQKEEACDTYCCRIQSWRLLPWLGSYVAGVQSQVCC